MNRRQFLQYTIALAAAAPLARIALLPEAQAAPLPVVEWVPTEAEVREWLQYYKLTVKMGSQKFHDAVGGLFNAQEFLDRADIVTTIDPALFLQAERSFESLEHDRHCVAYYQGQGYGEGRLGAARRNMAFTGPSNAGFAWYNGWLLGHNDLHGRVTPA